MRPCARAPEAVCSLIGRCVTCALCALATPFPVWQLGERRSPTRAEELAARTGPLPRQPFEFLAPASASSSRPQPQALAPQQLEQQPTRLPTPLAADGSGFNAGHPPPAQAETKQRKHGRLWRLMYGDSGSGVHRETVTH